MKIFLVLACAVLAGVPSPVQCFATLAHGNRKQRVSISVSSTTTDHNQHEDETGASSSCSGLLTRRRSLLTGVSPLLAMMMMITATTPPPARARLEAVNNPQLLPSQPGLNVIQTERVLTSGQVKRMDAKLAKLEQDTGYRVRVLCQNYPNTPGLAIREYWGVGGIPQQKDDKYVVLVVDQFGGRGNVLNFNVGDGLRLALSNNFWTQLRNKYGTTFFVRDNGVDAAVLNAVDDIVQGLYDASRELSS